MTISLSNTHTLNKNSNAGTQQMCADVYKVLHLIARGDVTTSTWFAP